MTSENLLTPQPQGGVTGVDGSMVAILSTLSNSTCETVTFISCEASTDVK